MANNTTAGSPTLVALTAAITVVAPYSGDDNNNNFCRFRYRVAGTGAWRDSFPMYVRRANKIWEGVIEDLQPSTEYELMLEYSDNDGASPPWTGVKRTRPDTSPIGTGPTIVATPETGLQAAVTQLVPGATILLRGGVYREEVFIYSDYTAIGGSTLGQNPGSWSGTRNPITIASYQGEPAIIDGEFMRSKAFWIGRYGRNVYDIILRGLVIRNTTGSNIRNESGGSGAATEYLTIEDCTLEEARRDTGSNAHLEMRGRYLIFRRNTVTNRAAPYWIGSTWKTDVQGIYLWQLTGGQHSVYDNLFQGGRYDDSVATAAEGSVGQGWVKDSEFYRNRIFQPNDDGWQFEGGCARVVGWKNYVENARKAQVAVAPVMDGPCYIFRNLFINNEPTTEAVAVKGGSGSPGKLYVVHNSFIRPFYGPARYGGSGWANQEYYNNLIWARGYCYWDVDSPSLIFDHNLLWTEGESGGNLIDCSSVYLGGQKFATLAAWQKASGQDLNSIQAFPLVDPLTGNLLPGSPAVDRAYFFPGWSEPYQGNGPDIGAFESGQTAQTYTLTTTVQGQGSISPSGGQFYQGQTVQITAIASPGWGFDHWEGDATGTNPSIILTMSGNKSIAAIFTQLPAVLTINITGNGSTSPSGVSSYPVGTDVTITATPFANNQFVEWQGTTETGNPIIVTMDSSKTITAVFAPIKHLVTIGASVGGTTDPTPGIYQFDEGSAAILTAIPDGSYYFKEWREGTTVVSVKNPFTFTVIEDKAYTAVFELIPMPPNEFGVSITTLGQGTTDPTPGAYTIQQGAVLTVLATPDLGWKLERWEYDTQIGTSNPLVVQVNSDLSIVATFVELPPEAPSPLPVIALVVGSILGLGMVLKGRK